MGPEATRYLPSSVLSAVVVVAAYSKIDSTAVEQLVELDEEVQSTCEVRAGDPTLAGSTLSHVRQRRGRVASGAGP